MSKIYPHQSTACRNPLNLQGQLLLHQTWKTRNLDVSLQHNVESWKQHNPEIRHILYDDTACEQLVQQEFPDYLEAYRSLRHPVERADLFRYMVLWTHGGVYADIDTFAVGPVRDLLQPQCRLLVAVEGASRMLNRREAERYGWGAHYANQRPLQYAQFYMIAERHHPALRIAIETIVHRTRFLDESSRPRGYTTIERTGPGVWSDSVNQAMREEPENHGVCIISLLEFQHAAVHQALGTWKQEYGFN